MFLNILINSAKEFIPFAARILTTACMEELLKNNCKCDTL